AIRYPWAPVADHAADALVALQDRDAAPMLVAQLGKPDPAAPFAKGRGAAVRELVRINHNTNCLLCHVPATGAHDPVIGLDPFSNRTVQSNHLVGNYGGTPELLQKALGGWTGLLIRADVQFLHQDFSVTFPIARAFGDEQGVRFDFTIRSRPLKPTEL